MTLLDSVSVSTVYSHKLYISHNAPYLPPQNLASAWFSISLGTAVIPRKNEKQRLCKILGSNLRCIMGDVQVANRPVSKYQNSYLALRLRGTTQKKWILESQCPFFSFTPVCLEAQYEFHNNIWKRPSIQGFWSFPRSRSRETHKYMQNTAKFARNLIEYNIFETYLGYWGCLIAVNLEINLETSSPQWVNNVPKLPGVTYVVKNWAQVMMLKALPLAHFSSTLWKK